VGNFYPTCLFFRFVLIYLEELTYFSEILERDAEKVDASRRIAQELNGAENFRLLFISETE
jgi:hypothetical protein